MSNYPPGSDLWALIDQLWSKSAVNNGQFDGIFRYLIGPSDSLTAYLTINPVQVGYVARVNAIDGSAEVIPSTWKCTATDAELPGGATPGELYEGKLYVQNEGDDYYVFEYVGEGSVDTDTGEVSTLRNDLASGEAGKGAAQVGFKQSGDGAGNRTVDAKLKESVSVDDYEPAKDGETDDAPAFNAAAVAAGGGGVLVPEGSYLLDTDTTPAIWLIDSGAQISGIEHLKGAVFKRTGLVNDYGLIPGRRWVGDSNPAKIHRFRDRVFVGASCENNGEAGEDRTHSWLDDPEVTGLKASGSSLEQNASLAVATDTGMGGIVAATRTSDWPLTGSPTLALTGLVLNDKDAPSSAVSGWAGYFVGILSPRANISSGGINNVEMNCWNQRGDSDAGMIDPYNFFPAKHVNNLWLSNGFPDEDADEDSYRASSAIGILNNATDPTKAKYRVGIAFKATALEGTDGVTGTGIAISMARGHMLQWYYGAGSTGPSIYSNVDASTNGVQKMVFGNNGLEIRNQSNTVQHLFRTTANSVNRIDYFCSAAGNPVRIQPEGSDTNIVLLLSGKGTGAVVSGSVLRPSTDNAYSCGSGSYRWTEIYAGTGTINTSDEREKQDIRDLSLAERAVAIRLKSLVKAFRFRDAVAKKGDDARIHFGVIAQEVIEAFEEQGLKAEDYALLCHDAWEAEDELRDEDGNIIRPAREAGDRYGVRYEEMLAFIISAL